MLRADIEGNPVVQILIRTGECDYSPVGDPIPFREALDKLRTYSNARLSKTELQYVDTGRLASWVL